MSSLPNRLIALLCLWLGLAVAPVAAQPAPPLILAAASLQESLNEAATSWAAKGHPKPVISFAGSSALARQIEMGAPADLFISADEQWMDYLAGKGLLAPGSRISFLGNQLALIAPATSRVRLHIAARFPLERALGPGRLAMADPDSVPAGKYGKEALVRLGAWNGVADKVARAENVRAALALVERGEAPLGIVYTTDARASAKVRIIGIFPANSHAPITYPVARLARSGNSEAEGFRRFLLSHTGKAVFRRYGFATR